MNTDFSKVRELARKFLELADRQNEKVSAYLNGSNDAEAVDAYYDVIAANRTFNKAYAAYYDEPMIQPHLDYRLAESVL